MIIHFILCPNGVARPPVFLDFIGVILGVIFLYIGACLIYWAFPRGAKN